MNLAFSTFPEITQEEEKELQEAFDKLPKEWKSGVTNGVSWYIYIERHSYDIELVKHKTGPNYPLYALGRKETSLETLEEDLKELRGTV